MTTELNVTQDLVPISRFGTGSKYVREVVQTGRPKLVTEAGVGVAVILDVETFEALTTEHAARELLRDLADALAEAEAGQLLDHEEVMAGVRERLGGGASESSGSQHRSP